MMEISRVAIGVTLVLLILKACGVISWWIVLVPLFAWLLFISSLWVFIRLCLWLAE